MTIAHLDAAAAALATHLQTALNTALGSGVAVVMVGWPDTQDYPVPGGSEKLRIAITYGQGSSSGHAPQHIGQGTYNATLLQRYGVGNWRTTFQVDVFAALKEHRNEGAAVVSATLFPRVAMGDAGLNLTSTGYHGDLVRMVPDGTSANEDADALASGRWTHTIALRARGRLITTSAVPLLVEAGLHGNGGTTLTVDSDGITLET